MAVVYQYPTDNVVGNATTITTSGNPSDYPPSFLWDAAPGSPAKLSATSGWFLFQFPGAQVVQLASLIHSNLAAGLSNVNIQANSINNWAAPPFNQSFTIPTWRKNGFPYNPWLDLRSLPGYNPAGYAWWRISFGTVNAANISVGELWLGSTYRSFPYGNRPGSDRGWKFNNSIDTTDAGFTLGYELAGPQRRNSFTVDYLSMSAPDKTIRDELHDWIEVCRGSLRPFLMVMDTTVNEAQLVKWSEDEISYSTSSLGKHELSIDVLEVGRGVAP
jgi:hypothetical protein